VIPAFCGLSFASKKVEASNGAFWQAVLPDKTVVVGSDQQRHPLDGERHTMTALRADACLDKFRVLHIGDVENDGVVAGGAVIAV